MTALHRPVAERSAELIAAGVPHVRATVVRAEHPTSVHAGDAAVVHADGTIEGFVGGTCAESSVQVHARAALQRREPLLLRILPGVEATTTEHGAVTVSNPCLSGGAVEIFLEPLAPPARLVVVGDTPIAMALQQFAEPLGYAVELVADGGAVVASGGAAAGDGAVGAAGGGAIAAGAVEVRPDDAGLIVASHGRGEEAALAAALRAGVPYVALVASRRRGAAVLDALDVPAHDRQRVSVPAGLDIGARTAPEIALSILAELIATRKERAPDVAEGVAPPEDRSLPLAPDPGTAVDPICGMTVLKADTTISAEVDGQTYWFCCAGCRDTFVAQHTA